MKNLMIFLLLLPGTPFVFAQSMYAQSTKGIELITPVSLAYDPYQSYPVYTGNDLGVKYSGSETILKVWSPPAQEMKLKIYKTSTGGVIGIKPVSHEIPKSYNLNQNYPNPFNPSTAIKFSVPISSVVKLSVYDALGREIESLVNEFLLPGTYEINWLAERFSSGIYFYRLLANDFSMVKKMSLIK